MVAPKYYRRLFLIVPLAFTIPGSALAQQEPCIGNSAAITGPAAFTGQAGQAVLTDLGGGQYRLAGDIDGDGLADFVLDITASGAFGWGDILS